MSRRKRSISDSITGVTTRYGEIVRVHFDRWTVIDIEHCTTYNAYPKGARAVKKVDKGTISKTVKAAQRWLKPPPGSIPITDHNKPPLRDHNKHEMRQIDWSRSDSHYDDPCER